MSSIAKIEFPMILKILDENLISSVSWEEVHKVKDTLKIFISTNEKPLRSKFGETSIWFSE
nr:MAG: hypothetical protein H2Bulk364773_000004 [Mitovirus sp.]